MRERVRYERDRESSVLCMRERVFCEFEYDCMRESSVGERVVYERE